MRWIFEPSANTPACLVADRRVVLPAVPELLGDLDELLGALVAVGMQCAVVEAEVERGVAAGGGDDVPADAAAADVIDRGEPPREVVGLAVAGRRRRDQADALGR